MAEVGNVEKCILNLINNDFFLQQWDIFTSYTNNSMGIIFISQKNVYTSNILGLICII